jgi:hypothetical protein
MFGRTVDTRSGCDHIAAVTLPPLPPSPYLSAWYRNTGACYSKTRYGSKQASVHAGDIHYIHLPLVLCVRVCVRMFHLVPYPGSYIIISNSSAGSTLRLFLAWAVLGGWSANRGSILCACEGWAETRQANSNWGCLSEPQPKAALCAGPKLRWRGGYNGPDGTLTSRGPKTTRGNGATGEPRLALGIQLEGSIRTIPWSSPPMQKELLAGRTVMVRMKVARLLWYEPTVLIAFLVARWRDGSVRARCRSVRHSRVQCPSLSSSRLYAHTYTRAFATI